MLSDIKYLQKIFEIWQEIVYNRTVNFNLGGSMKKRYNLRLALSSFLLFALIVFVLGPVLISVGTNIVYADTVLPNLLDILVDIVQIAAFVISYSIIFYCAYKLTVKQVKDQIFIFLSALLFYYVANTLVSYFSAISFDPVELVYTAISFALELLLHGVIIGCGLYIINKGAKEKSLPFKTRISFSNPVQRAIGITALVMSGSKVIERIIYDFRIGAPKSTIEVLEMVIYYASDLLVGVAVYFVMTYLILMFYSRDEKEKADA